MVWVSTLKIEFLPAKSDKEIIALASDEEAPPPPHGIKNTQTIFYLRQKGTIPFF